MKDDDNFCGGTTKNDLLHQQPRPEEGNLRNRKGAMVPQIHVGLDSKPDPSGRIRENGTHKCKDIGASENESFWNEQEQGKDIVSHNKLENGYGNESDAEIDTGQHCPEDPLLPANVSDVEREEELVLTSGTPKSDGQETSFMIAIQVFFPFLVAGIGTVTAGLLLDVVQVYFFFSSLFLFLGVGMGVLVRSVFSLKVPAKK